MVDVSFPTLLSDSLPVITKLLGDRSMFLRKPF